MEHLLIPAFQKARFVYVGITNPDPSLTRHDSVDTHRSTPEANPYHYFERVIMVNGALLDANIDPNRFCIVPFPINIPESWKYYAPEDAVYMLSICEQWGYRKLSMLNEIGVQTEIIHEGPKQLTGTEIREKMVRGGPWEQMVPIATQRVTLQFGVIERLIALTTSAHPA